MRRHIVSGLGAALAAMGFGFWLHSANVMAASAKAQAGAPISPQELHRSIDMKSLPDEKFEDRTFVFPR
jgi:hypothetical protein